MGVHRWKKTLLCWFLSFIITICNYPITMQSALSELVAESDYTQELVEWFNYSVLIENASVVTDNPWGINAGVLDTGTDGDCIFLTPGTSAQVFFPDEMNGNTAFELKIHPWVSLYSDGVEVYIDVIDICGNLLDQTMIPLDSQSTVIYQPNTLYNSQCKKIVFRCDNGAKNSSDADWLIIKKVFNQASTFGREGYVKSATFFADAWPINFWNSELDYLDNDLHQIKKDGFDSIILVIPWKEFQSCTNPIQYNDYAFEQLDRVMTAARQVGLDVYTRVSYMWDFYNDMNEYMYYRIFNLFCNDTVRNAWLDYIKHLYQQVSCYPNYKAAFLTWEDFWGTFVICDIDSEETRIHYADSFGYQEWIRNNFGSLEEYNYLYGTDYVQFESIPIPHRNEPAMESMYQFYDECLNRLLREAQTVFPNISMEVRLDADLVYTKDGTAKYYFHQSTYGCELADYVATMYGIPMGFENVGEKVSALDAIQHTQYILNGLKSQNGGKPIYVEQFIFADNTPQFSYNAQIMEDEVDDYLVSIYQILKEYTSGYGVWTYRDYANNMFYNNGFYLGDCGWDIFGSVQFEEMNGSMACHMRANSSISQIISDIRNHFDQQNFTISFEVVKVINQGSVTVMMGTEAQTIMITQEGSYSVTFPKNTSFNVSIVADSCEFYLDNLCMASFIQHGFLYDIHNQELPLAESIRIMNNLLDTD